jgi:hypothetical protein
MRHTSFRIAKGLTALAVLAALFGGWAPRDTIAHEAGDTKATPAAAERYPRMAPLERYLMADRQAEIALARSAAPSSISSDATVLVLTRRGYEQAAEGKNGFVCLVDRSWQAPFADPEFWNPNVRSPVCLNPQAARSVLSIIRKRTELALAGLSKTEIMVRIKNEIDKKELALPEIGAMSYMMSKEQYLSDEFQHWQPHVMFYVPSTIKGNDWGANLPNSPVLVGPEQLPDGGCEPVIVFLLPVSQWSDGTTASGGH